MLDIRTVMFSYVIANFINAGVIFLLWWHSRRRFKGTSLWLADYLMQFAAVLLIALRDVLPQFAAVMLGNSMVIAGTIFLYMGLERFVGRRGIQVQNAVLLGAFIAVQAYFYYASPNLAARNVNLSLALLLLCGQCAWLMLRRTSADMRPLAQGVGLVFVGYCIASLFRIAADLSFPPGSEFFQSTVYDALVLLTYQMLFIVLTFTLFLMVNRRLIGDLERDVTARTKVEDILRMRLALWEYAATHTVSELMQKALDEIEPIMGSPIGFYHFVQEDQTTLSLQAWSTRTLREFCTAEGIGMHYDLDRAGVWADSVRERKPIIHNDYASLPNRKGMPAGHAKIIRELIVPTLRAGNVVSVLGVGNKPTEYNAKDADLLSDISDIIWTVIDHKRTEEKIQGLQAKLQEMAIHDSLTGLHNRYHLDETLERELARAGREDYPIGFIMIDIDHFKRVNDTFGHQVGDAVLQKLAEQLLKESRAGDILYRYGGEEFLAILPKVNAEYALLVAEKWRKSFQGSSVLPEPEDGKLTISCGIASYPEHGETGAELIANSDQALYRAKTAGRNRSAVWK